ncbi:MAG: efflux RND transporter periplasmic adaptor subunit, partial [Verrucomicrobiota bacterium]
QPPQSNGGEELILVGEAKTIVPGPYRVHFMTTGIVEAKTEIDIVPQVSGRVAEVADQFDAGGRFDGEQTLFQLEEEDLLFEVQRLEADVARAETALTIEQARGDAAVSDWKRLGEQQPIPSLVKREPQLREAEVNLQAAEAQYNKAKLQLARASYRLPSGGRVLESRIAEGQYLQAGVSYGKVFYFDDLEVVSSLNDQNLNWLYSSENPEIVITATHLGRNVTSRGILDRRAASLNPQTRFASVRFRLQEGAESLLPGVFVNIQILGATYEGVSQIPLSAVQQGGHLWLVDEEDRLRKHLPDILSRTPDHLAIRSLGQASRVMVHQLPGAVEGAKVKLHESESDSALAER